ncbi:MAG TPA: hypothetical protein PKK43_10295, partial [Spirochaetota bacterium]|nr:hypothetical protein [Spirochaetota bacterium]
MDMTISDKKRVLRLPFRIFMVSDCIAFCVNLPITIGVIYYSFDITPSQMAMFGAVTFGVIAVSSAATIIHLRSFLSPVLVYLRKAIDGQHATTEEYRAAKIRFYSIPRVRSISGALIWLISLTVALAVMIVLLKASFSSIVTGAVIVVINVFSILSYFYISIDRQIRKVAAAGFFSRRIEGEEKMVYRNSSVLSVLIIGVVALLCTVLLFMTHNVFHGVVMNLYGDTMRQSTAEMKSLFEKHVDGGFHVIAEYSGSDVIKDAVSTGESAAIDEALGGLRTVKNNMFRSIAIVKGKADMKLISSKNEDSDLILSKDVSDLISPAFEGKNVMTKVLDSASGKVFIMAVPLTTVDEAVVVCAVDPVSFNKNISDDFLADTR